MSIVSAFIILFIIILGLISLAGYFTLTER